MRIKSPELSCCIMLYFFIALVLPCLPPDEVVDEVFDSLLQLRFLKRDWVTFVGDLHHQFPQFVQLTLDLEETLCCQSEPERRQERGKPQGREKGKLRQLRWF